MEILTVAVGLVDGRPVLGRVIGRFVGCFLVLANDRLMNNLVMSSAAAASSGVAATTWKARDIAIYVIARIIIVFLRNALDDDESEHVGCNFCLECMRIIAKPRYTIV